MKRCCFVWLVFMCAGFALAEEFELDTNAIKQAVESVGQWADENIDADVLQALGQADREKVGKFVRDLQKGFQDQYVLDLASLKVAANIALPLLEAHKETQPYGAWLKARLDYLDVAEELRRA